MIELLFAERERERGWSVVTGSSVGQSERGKREVVQFGITSYHII